MPTRTFRHSPREVEHARAHGVRLKCEVCNVRHCAAPGEVVCTDCLADEHENWPEHDDRDD